MENILHELYYGNIRPSEGRLPKSPEYKTAIADIEKYESELLSKLNDKGKELYRKLTLAIILRDVIEYEYIFEDAFKLGVKIILACLIEKGDM